MKLKDLVILFVSIFTVALCAMNLPSRIQNLSREAGSEESSASESSENVSASSREESVRERPVKRAKERPSLLETVRPILDPQVETLIERAAVPQSEIDAFFLDLSYSQIRVLNKIMFFSKRGQVAYLMASEQNVFDALPEFVKQLFKDV